MRLGEKSIFGSARGRRAGRKFSGVLVILLFVSIFVFSALYSLNTLVPTLLRIAENEAKIIGTQTANKAAAEVFDSLKFEYTDLFSFEKTESGKIVALKSDMINVNRIKSAVAMNVQGKISEIKTEELEIPLGALMGSDVFAGVGPFVSFELMPVGAAIVDVISEFADSGINQTHLTISLKVNTDIALLMPGIRRMTKVSCDVPVIDTVIVGDVPSSYVNVDREGYEFEDDVLQLAEE